MLTAAFFLLVVAGAAADPNWDNPQSGDTLTGTVDLGVTDSDDEGPFDIFYREEGSDSWSQAALGGDGELGTGETGTLDTTGLSLGAYELNATFGDYSDSNIIPVDVDNSGPQLDDDDTFPSPGDTISENEPDIELRFDDSPANVDASSVDIDSLENSDGDSFDFDELDEDDIDDGDDFEVTEDLTSEETYTVDWVAEDTVGNTESDESFEFTVDSGYNGPTGVSLEPGDGNVIGLDDDEFQLDITVDENDDGDTEIEVGCYGEYDDPGFDDEYDTGTVDSDGDEDDRTFTCDVDVSEYDDGDTIYIGLADQAGNRYSEDNDEITASYEIDTRPPLIQSLNFVSTSVEDPTFSENFDVSVEVDDDTGSTSRVEYYFDEDTDEGDGNALDWEGDGEYTIETDDLTSGDQTLYLRARDTVGDEDDEPFHGYSSVKELDFRFEPDASQSVDLRAPNNVTVTAGESGTLDVTAANTGGAFISEFNVSVSGFFSGQKKVEQLRSGAEAEASFGFDTSESDLGSASVTARADEFDASRDTTIKIEANQEQRSSVKSELETYSNELESLRSNYTELKSKVSGARESNLTSRFTEYESLVQDTRSAVESDDYAEAQEILSDAQPRLETSQNSISDTQSFVESRNRRNTIIMAAVGLLAVMGIGVGGFIYSERYGLDIKQAVDSDIPTTSVDGLKSRLRTIFTDEEDADEFEWSGFED